MSKEWRIMEIALPIGKPYWQVTNRKITSEEADELFNACYSFEADVLDVYASGRFVTGCVTLPGATKKQAEEECKRLNNGKNPFENLFNEEEQD